jgi:hypothetical protein
MNDSDLRNLFHLLRDEDALHLPSPRLRGEGAPKGRMRDWALAVIAMVILMVITLRNRPEPTASILTWTPPTDVLLRTPGSELLTTVPRIPDLPERK